MALITTTEAARRLVVIPRRVRQFIEQERLPAVRLGRDWLIEEADLARLEGRKWGAPGHRPR